MLRLAGRPHESMEGEEVHGEGAWWVGSLVHVF